MNLFLWIMALSATAQAQQAPAPCLLRPEVDRAYSKQRLIAVVRDQTPARAEYLIRTCGVQTVWSVDLESELRSAGAGDRVIQAVKEKAPAPPPPPTPKAKQPEGPKAGDVRENPKDGQRYVYIPAGTFLMGCSGGDTECFDDEKPSHEVRITRGYWMGQTEVTVGAYKRFAAAKGKPMPVEPTFMGRGLNPGWSNDTLPMNQVDWNDARDYCSWAGMALPNEAEWEYAARAGETSARYGPLEEIAWFADNSGNSHLDSKAILKKKGNKYTERLKENGNGPKPVAQKRPNLFGLYDTLGNLWEWTADWYSDKAYASSESIDPKGPDSGTDRVVRGGSVYDRSRYVRLSVRGRFAPSYRYLIQGFRCAGELRIP
jgi:formylglycine-generating enzyme required for sulfatase activity